MGRGWFVMPDVSLIDVTSDFGEGSNDHVGIFVIADNASEFGVTRKEALSALDEVNESGDPTTLMELWKKVYDKGIIRVRQFGDVLAINSMNPIPLAHLQQLMEKGKIPTTGVKTVDVEGLMGAPGGDVYRVPIADFRTANLAKDIAPISRYSPKQESPSIPFELRPYFTRGKNAPNEQTAKTQAGMIRKQNLPAAKAMMAGFYSAHPAVTPRPPAWYLAPASAPANVSSAPASTPIEKLPIERPVVSTEPYKEILDRLTRNMKIIGDGIRALQTNKPVDLSGVKLNEERGAVETTDAAGLPEFPANVPLDPAKRFIVQMPTTNEAKKRNILYSSIHSLMIQLKKAIPTFQGGKSVLAEPVAWNIRHLWSEAQRKSVTVLNDYFGGSGGWGAFLARHGNFDNVKELNVFEFNADRMLKIKFLYEHGGEFYKLFNSSGLEGMFNALEKEMLQTSGRNATSSSTMFKSLDSLLSRNPGKIPDDQWRGMVQYLVDYGSARFGNIQRDGEDVAPQKAIEMLSQQAVNLFDAVQELRDRGVKITIKQADSYSLTPVSGKHVLSVFDPPYYNTTGYSEDGKPVRVDIDFYRKNVAMLDKLVAADNNVIYTDETWWTENKSDKKSDSEKAIIAAERPEAEQLLARVQKAMPHFDIWKVKKRFETIGMRNAMETEGQRAELSRFSAKQNDQGVLQKLIPVKIPLVDISGRREVRDVLNAMHKEDRARVAEGLARLPTSIAEAIKGHSYDDYELEQISEYGQTFRTTAFRNVAPVSMQAYRPAVVMSDGTVVFGGRIHVDSIAKYNIKNGTEYSGDDVQATGGIAPDGSFYAMSFISDTETADIRKAERDIRKYGKMRFSPKTLAPAFYSQLRKDESGTDSSGTTELADSLNSETSNPVVDALRSASDDLRNLTAVESFKVKGFDGLSDSEKATVSAGVITAIGNDKIRRGVIARIPVNVMNQIRASKFSANEFLGDKAMLSDSLSGNPDANVPLSNDARTALVKTTALSATERVLKSSNAVGASVDRNAADKTSGFHEGNVALLSAKDKLSRVGMPIDNYEGKAPKFNWNATDNYGKRTKDSVAEFTSAPADKFVYQAMVDLASLKAVRVEKETAKSIRDGKENIDPSYLSDAEEMLKRYVDPAVQSKPFSRNEFEDWRDFLPWNYEDGYDQSDVETLAREMQARSEESSYDDEGTKQSFGAGFPPIVVTRKANGDMIVNDGNHRADIWREQGYDVAPAWVNDEQARVRSSKLQSKRNNGTTSAGGQDNERAGTNEGNRQGKGLARFSDTSAGRAASVGLGGRENSADVGAKGGQAGSRGFGAELSNVAQPEGAFSRINENVLPSGREVSPVREYGTGDQRREVSRLFGIFRNTLRPEHAADVTLDEAWGESEAFKTLAAPIVARGLVPIPVRSALFDGAFSPGMVAVDVNAKPKHIEHELYHAQLHEEEVAGNGGKATELHSLMDVKKGRIALKRLGLSIPLDEESDHIVREEAASFMLDGRLKAGEVVSDVNDIDRANRLASDIKADRSVLTSQSKKSATSPKQGAPSPESLRKAVLDNAGRLDSRMTGTKAWLTPEGKWINVYDHSEALPYDQVPLDTGVPDMTKAGFVRVAWEGGVTKMLHAEYDRATITPMQRSELKNTAIEKGGEVAYDPGYANYSGKEVKAVTPAQDAAYLAAVERGDTAEAQRMVDEAAKAAGVVENRWAAQFNQSPVGKMADKPKNSLVWFHGTQAEPFNEFKTSGINRGTKDPISMLGVHLADQRYVSEQFAEGLYGDKSKKGRVVEAYVASKNPKVFSTETELRDDMAQASLNEGLISKEQAPRDSVLDNGDIFYGRGGDIWRAMSPGAKRALYSRYIESLRKQGHDSIVYGNLVEGIATKAVIVFDPSQVKSADAVTRDDQGRVIPLSERFNEASPDIRYSPKDSNTDAIRQVIDQSASDIEALKAAGQQVPAEMEAQLAEARKALSGMETAPVDRKKTLASMARAVEDTGKVVTGMVQESIEARQALADALSDEDAGNEARKVAEGRVSLRSAIERLAVLTARGERNAIRTIKVSIGHILKARLPMEERGRFIHRLAVAQTNDDIEEVALAIDSVAEQYQKKQLIKLIRKISDKAIESPSVAVDYRKRIADLLDGVLLTNPTQATIDKVQATKDYIEAELAAGREAEVPRRILAKLRILTAKPASTMDVSELEDIVGELNLLAKQGKAKLDAKKAIDAAQKVKDFDALKAQGTRKIESADMEKGDLGEPPTWGMKMRNLLAASGDNLRKWYLWHTPTDRVMDILDNNLHYRGIIFAMYKGRPGQAYAEFRRAIFPLEGEFKAILEKHNIKKRESDRVGIYAVAKQRNGDDKNYGRKKIYNNTGATTDEQKADVDRQIDAIVLTPDEQAYYDFMRKKMDEVRPMLAKAAKDIFNADLDQVSDYFPMQTDWDLQENEVLDGWTLDKDHQLIKKNPEDSMLKKRTGAGNQRVRTDSAKAFMKHMNDAHYLIHMAPVTRYLNEFARRPDVKELVGDEGQRYLVDYVDTLARRGGVGGEHIIEWVDTLRRNVGVGTLGFRLSSILIQPSSFVDSLGKVGPRWGLKGATHIMTDGKWRKFVFDNMQQVRDRIGDDPAYAESGALKWLNKATQYGYLPLEMLDRYTAAAVGAAAYEKYMHEHGLEVDLDKPNAEALAEAELTVRLTQASGNFMDVPQVVSRGKGYNSKTLAKAIYQFQTFTMNKFSFMAHDAIGYGVSDREWGQAFMMMLWAFMAYLTEEAVRSNLKVALGGERKKTDSILDEAMIDFATAVPLLGPIINSTRYGSVPVPVVSTAQNLQKAGASLVNAKTPEGKMRAGLSSAGALGTLAGIPGSGQISQFFKTRIHSDSEKAGLLINDSAKRLPKTASAGLINLESQKAFNRAKSQGLLNPKTTAAEFRARYKSRFKAINKP